MKERYFVVEMKIEGNEPKLVGIQEFLSITQARDASNEKGDNKQLVVMNEVLGVTFWEMNR